MADKEFNLFKECAHLFPQEEECTSSSWVDSKMYTSGSKVNSQKIVTKENESGAIARIRILVECDIDNH